MAIVSTIHSPYQFEQAFRAAGRFGGDNDNFTYQGLGILFEYLEELSEETGENIELDVIALCCDYTESDVESIIEEYNIDVSDVDITDMDQDEIDNAKMEIVREWLQERTVICGEYDSTFVYCSAF